MSIDLPLEKMTPADKLEAMELLWAELSKTPDKVPSPEWHGEVLADRRRLVEEGKMKFLDSEVAIEELKAEVRIR